MIQPLALDVQHANDVAPLSLRDCPATPVPLELAEDGALGLVHEDCDGEIGEPGGDAAAEALAGQGIVAGDEQIHFDRRAEGRQAPSERQP